MVFPLTVILTAIPTGCRLESLQTVSLMDFPMESLLTVNRLGYPIHPKGNYLGCRSAFLRLENRKGYLTGFLLMMTRMAIQTVNRLGFLLKG